jgi:acyl-CoA synthetase (AMP-forming)/AMP-acid ligase II
MLYERWRHIAHEFRGEVALRELGTGRAWSFQQLAEATERGDVSSELFACPRGMTADFVFTLLRGWRKGQIICPLESELEENEIQQPPAGIVHLKRTSASTSAARLVGFTASQLVADASNIVQTMGLRSAWPNLGAISLAHSYGFSNLVLPLLLHGVPLFLLETPWPEAIRKALRQFNALTLPAVPALWRAWLDADALSPSLQLAISAGAPLPVALEQEVFEKTGIKVHNFYGASECGGVAYDPSPTPRTDGAFVGSPLRNVQLSVPATGCLEVRGEAVGQTYWPTPQPELAHGVFRTSDLAEIIDGQVYLRGRATDLINVAGRKVAPETIENVLRQHPHVRNCLVFGVCNSQPDRTESIVACVEMSSPPEKEILRGFLLQALPAWQVPREWWFTELGANSRGKLSRTEWRERYQAQRADK